MNTLISSLGGPAVLLSMGVGGLIGVIGAAFALGIRHGIDWDHIAAITDITSTAASVDERDQGWLVREPAFMLTDESHHTLVAAGGPVAMQTAVAVGAMSAHSHSIGEMAHRHNGRATGYRPALESFVRKQKPGSCYSFQAGKRFFRA